MASPRDADFALPTAANDEGGGPRGVWEPEMERAEVANGEPSDVDMLDARGGRGCCARRPPGGTGVGADVLGHLRRRGTPRVVSRAAVVAREVADLLPAPMVAGELVREEVGGIQGAAAKQAHCAGGVR